LTPGVDLWPGRHSLSAVGADAGEGDFFLASRAPQAPNTSSDHCDLTKLVERGQPTWIHCSAPEPLGSRFRCPVRGPSMRVYFELGPVLTPRLGAGMGGDPEN
jgi:hypothetical protein